MANETGLDGRGLFVVNFGGGLAFTAFSYYLNRMTSIGDNLGLGIAWLVYIPFILIPLFAFALWLQETILLWAWRYRSKKPQFIFGLIAACLILLLPYLLNRNFMTLWESSWTPVVSGAMLLWSCVLSLMRNQLWLEAEMLEKQRQEDN